MDISTLLVVLTFIIISFYSIDSVCEKGTTVQMNRTEQNRISKFPKNRIISFYHTNPVQV